jgi:hypothetical protein
VIVDLLMDQRSPGRECCTTQSSTSPNPRITPTGRNAPRRAAPPRAGL